MSKNILLEADINELETKLLEITNDRVFVKKLLALGEPFKKACRILGFNINGENGGNPLLAFVIKQKNFVNTGLINANTFKALYNAVAKKLVADSEFFTTNNYNILYCENLYKKTPKEIEEYLEAQKTKLSPDADAYDLKKQLINRKTFLYIKGLHNVNGEEELNIAKRAELIKKLTDANKIPEVNNAHLNSLALVKSINGIQTDLGVHRTESELDKIVAKLTNVSSKFAAILLLCSKSKVVKQALTNPKFGELDQAQIADAFARLVSDNTIPQGHLREDDANVLIAKILATLESKHKENSKDETKQ